MTIKTIYNMATLTQGSYANFHMFPYDKEGNKN